MERQVAIIAGAVELEAELYGTDTAEAVWNAFQYRPPAILGATKFTFALR